MWYIHKGVILTKDNLSKRRWDVSKRCCFCDQEETIQHLFLKCALARLLWRTIHVSFNIFPSSSISNLFANCLNGVKPNTAACIRVGVCVLLWAIWNSRNAIVFNQTNITNFLQVIFRAFGWIRTLSLLSRADVKKNMNFGCNH